MEYIDATYYTDEFGGVPIDQPELDRLIKRASRDIDMMTQNRIVDFDAMHETLQGYIRLATASQVEYLNEYGETASSMGQGSGNFTIGSYSERQYASEAKGKQSPSFSYAAGQYLMASGLLYAGVDVRGSWYCG